MKNSISGFKACSIHPFNPDIFPEYLYQPSSTTDCPVIEDNVEVTELNNEPVVNNENQEDLTIKNIINNVSPIPLNSILSKRPNTNIRSTGCQVLTKSPLINEFKEKQRVKDTIERKN